MKNKIYTLPIIGDRGKHVEILQMGLKNLVVLLLFSFSNLMAQETKYDTIRTFHFLELPYQSIPKVSLTPYKSVQTRANQNPKLALGISLSGGGSRAQYFSTGVLIGLDDIKTKDSSTILKEVDYFSTVSGGGFAAGNYLALLKKRREKQIQFNNLGEFWGSDRHYNDFDERMKIKIKKLYLVTRFGRESLNYSNNILSKVLLAGDIKGTKCFEKEIFLQNIMPYTNSDSSVKYPFLVPNGSIYTNGDILPFMPHIIDALHIKSYKKPLFFFSFLFWKVKNRKFEGSFPLEYAIGTSAAFPGMLPMYNYSMKSTNKKPTKTEKIIKAFDGGLADNLGVNTLDALLKNDKEVNFKKAIIVNNASSGIESPYTNRSNIKLPSFLAKSALYAVEINIKENEQNLKSHFGKENYVYIGLSDFKSIIDRDNMQNINIELNKYLNKTTWSDFQNEFLNRIKAKNIILNNSSHISTIKREDFAKLDDVDLFYIFELASNVETKIKIEDFEREVLILAGRFMVFKKEDEIRKKIYD